MVLNSETAPVVLFMGAPGSGKGTQSGWLAASLGIPVVATGELLRAEASRNTSEGFRIRQLQAEGALVDDNTVCNVVDSRLRRNTPRRGVILDGFPRTVRQAEFLDQLLDDLELPRPTLLHLDVSTTGILRRLAGRRQCAVCGSVYNLRSKPSLKGSRCQKDGGALVQRDDDTEGVILHRMAEFESSTAPILAYYGPSAVLRIDADRDASVVAADILHAVAPGTAYHLAVA